MEPAQDGQGQEIRQNPENQAAGLPPDESSGPAGDLAGPAGSAAAQVGAAGAQAWTGEAAETSQSEGRDEGKQPLALPPGGSALLSGLALVMVATCLVFFNGLGRYPLFNPDEALYAEPAREMLVTGEYVTTLLNYVVRYTKPPLVIWAMAAAYKVFGVNEFAARFFGVSCGVLLVALVYLIIARYISTRAAVVGALSLTVAPLFALTSREAITDMPLALFMAGSQMALYHAFRARRFSFALGGYFLLGLAVMTKGPVGIVLPLAIIFAYQFLRGELKTALAFYRPLWAAAVIGVVAIPWFATEIWVTKGAYFQEFIVRENFQRFTTVVDSHKQPFWYHAAAMFGGYFPYCLYLPQVFCRQLKTLMPALARDGSLMARYEKLKSFLQGQSEAEDLYFYCLIWALAVLVFFSLSVSKLLPYTLPAFPAMAILVAGELEAALAASSFIRLCYPVLAMILIYAWAGAIAPKLMLKARSLPPGLTSVVTDYAAIQAAAALISLVLCRFKKYAASATFLVVAGCAIFAAYLNRALPLVSAKLEGPIPSYAFFAGQSDLPVIVFDMRKPGVPFYAHRRVENVNGGEELRQKLSSMPDAYILTTVNKLDFLKTLKEAKLMSSGGDYALLHFVNAELAGQK